MSELPRRIASQLRRFFGNRRRARRASAKLTFTLGLDSTRASSNGSRKLPSLGGHTLDISTTGMALVVPAIRIGEHYLTGDERRLRVKLELPDGPVEMWMVPVRYESLEEDAIESGYVIGARITQMSETHRARFEKYIAQLLGKQPSHESITQVKRREPKASGT
jgi:c-di-GMP-binding flagellar brake protein YcgR